MTKKFLQIHDLPNLPVRPLRDPKKLTVVTTSNFDIKGKLKDTARKRIEGGEEDVEKSRRDKNDGYLDMDELEIVHPGAPGEAFSRRFDKNS